MAGSLVVYLVESKAVWWAEMKAGKWGDRSVAMKAERLVVR